MATEQLAIQPAAVVLVGGASSRMGTDKATLVVNGVPMSERVVRAARSAGVERVLLAGTEAIPDAVSSVTGSQRGDPTPRQGPMAGIVGAWRSMQMSTGVDPVVVLSCDLPWLTTDVVRRLMTCSERHAQGAVAHDGERPQPLIGAYRHDAMMRMAAAFDAGERSVRHLMQSWDIGHVACDPQVIADADTPRDLQGFDVQWPTD